MYYLMHLDDGAIFGPFTKEDINDYGKLDRLVDEPGRGAPSFLAAIPATKSELDPRPATRPEQFVLFDAHVVVPKLTPGRQYKIET